MAKFSDSILEIRVLLTILKTQKFDNFSSLVELFHSDECKEIANRIFTLIGYGKKPLLEVLERDEAISQVSRTILLANKDSVLEDLDSAIAELREYQGYRSLHSTISAIVEEYKKPKPDRTIADNLLRNYLEKSTTRASGWDCTSISLTDGIEWVEETLRPVDKNEFFKTGFKEFDSNWMLKSGHLLVISAPSGHGKSILMQVLASNFYKYNDASVAEVSFEMTEEELRERRLSHLSKIEYKKISAGNVTPEERIQIQNSLTRSQKSKKLSSLSTYLDIGITELSIKFKDYNVVLIDYLGLLKTDEKKSQQEAYGEIARQAKLMAKKNNQLVVLLTQLDDKEHVVKYSKAIKANCDFLWTFWLDDNKENNTVTINQQKVRHGEMKDFQLRHDLNRIYFGDMIYEEKPKEGKKVDYDNI